MASEQTVEYVITMPKTHSDALARMSVSQGEDNELVYLEKLVIDTIEVEMFFDE